MKNFKETILAQSTPPGNGGIGIIRISGSKSVKISKKIIGKKLKPRYAEYLPFKDKNKNIIDYGIVIFYKKPKSFTGEDIIELHSHGGQKIIQFIIKSIINLNYKNVRIANPGEFTERAFLNNKIDLIQAESINELINSNSEKSLKLAIKSFLGNLSKIIKYSINNINNLITYIETEINFSKKIKNLNFKINKKINLIYKHLKYIYKESKQSLEKKNGIIISIIGEPNVGKSSLMNFLTKKDTSIITNIPGTTRDIIKEYININNINLEINDTTGIHKTNNKIENIGIKKTFKIINKSKLIIFMDDASKTSEKKIYKKYNKLIKNNTKINIKKKKIIFIRNKIDLTKEKIKGKITNIINISIKKKIGLHTFIKKIKNILKKYNNSKNNFLSQERHLIIIKKTIKNIKNIIKIISINKSNYLDLITNELIIIKNQLNQILGKNIHNSEIILNKIFSTFCIGK